ncbi:MAG: peptide-methionine (S)-S-oxide reductase MsrA [Bacteroidota bacterium]
MRVIRLFFIIITSVVYISCAQEQQNQLLTGDPVEVDVPEGMEVATFAGGCFWCTEAVFERVKGVESVVSGYSGGKELNPTYYQVGSGRTGHAEAIQIIYDPKVVSYDNLLEIFFATHDPTTLNRQGPDVGPQYRSAVFYHNDGQKKAAAKYVNKLSSSGKFSNKIVTQRVPYLNFYEAEDYHQDYYEINPNQGYIVQVTRPKVNKFIKQYPQYLKDKYKK